MGGEARQTALYVYMAPSQRSTQRFFTQLFLDETELVGLAAYLFLARHSAECADQICKELPRGSRRIGRTGLERQRPCKPFTGNLARDLIANFTNSFFLRGIPIE